MILTTHALAGAVIGKNINNIWLIILLATLMHFVFDSLRHGEYLKTINKKSTIGNTWWKIALDLSLGLTLVFTFIFWENPNPIKLRDILFGSFFSMFPDLLTFLYWKFKIKFLETPYHFHSWAHRAIKKPVQRNWNLRNGANDILLSVASMLLLFFV